MYGEKKVKWSRYRPGVAQRVGRGIALLFHEHGTRRGWVVSTPRPHFTPGKHSVPILQGAGWAPGLVWTGGKSCPHWDSIQDHPARSQSLYRLSYPAHNCKIYEYKIYTWGRSWSGSFKFCMLLSKNFWMKCFSLLVVKSTEVKLLEFWSQRFLDRVKAITGNLSCCSRWFTSPTQTVCSCFWVKCILPSLGPYPFLLLWRASFASTASS